MNIITILRDYLGITQQELAKQANITQCDLCEMETKEPYGQIMKYQRVAKVLGVPVHALVTNNCTLVPESFFETHQHAEYLETTDRLGREGEECAWHMEQEKLGGIFPVLARLVIPYYKLRRYSPGYDILSFDEHGKPIFIEVKTTTYGEDKDFRMTVHEHTVANKLTAKGERYYIYRYTNWGKKEQKLHVIPFQAMLDGARITPGQFTCSMTDRETQVCGIAYFRRLRGMTQEEMASQLGILQQHLCRYEKTERKCSIPMYRKMADLLEVTIDELLETYPVSALEAERYG